MDKKKLILDNMNLVYSIYYDNFAYTYYYIDKDDLISEGMLGLVKAASTYKPNKTKFSTYAYHCIKNHMINYCNKEYKHKNVLSFEDYI